MISPGARQQKALSHLITTAQLISLQAMLSTCTTFFWKEEKKDLGKKNGESVRLLCVKWSPGQRVVGTLGTKKTVTHMKPSCASFLS